MAGNDMGAEAGFVYDVPKKGLVVKVFYANDEFGKNGIEFVNKAMSMVNTSLKVYKKSDYGNPMPCKFSELGTPGSDKRFEELSNALDATGGKLDRLPVLVAYWDGIPVMNVPIDGSREQKERLKTRLVGLYTEYMGKMHEQPEQAKQKPQKRRPRNFAGLP